MVIAAGGQLVGYGLSMLLARRLGVAGFEAYVVASAAFILLAAFAPLGTEKHALRQLPALLQRADWGLACGLLQFGLRRTLITAVLTGLAVGAWSAAWVVAAAVMALAFRRTAPPQLFTAKPVSTPAARSDPSGRPPTIRGSAALP